MKNSHIGWTDHTFNPWIGCTKVDDLCLHCYAETRDKRFADGIHWGKGAPRQRTSLANWKQPLAWNRDAAGEGMETLECPSCDAPWSECDCGFAQRNTRVFCASLADWLDEEVSIEWLSDLLGLIDICEHLDWQLLTKRPENWRSRLVAVTHYSPASRGGLLAHRWLEGRYPENVWFGASVGHQRSADERLPIILRIPAKIRFLSCEPLLGPVDIRYALYTKLLSPGVLNGNAFARSHNNAKVDWVICGGESGKGARPMHPDWARSLRDQCAVAGVPFYFKQWGEWCPLPETMPADAVLTEVTVDDRTREFKQMGLEGMVRIGKLASGRHLDGSEHSAFPS